MYVMSMQTLASSGVYYAFEHSDLCGKSIVILLMVGSIAAWSIMFEKWISVKRLRDNSNLFIKSFNQKQYFLMSIGDSKKLVGPASKIYAAALAKITEFHGAGETQLSSMIQMGKKPPKALSPAQLDVIRAAVDKEMSDQIKILEERMGFLATCVSASPFFGLFGTVWGVMLAFCSLAELGRAEISALAPGVAGALLTTVAGLLVAIPSLIGYNLLTASITSQVTDLEDFADQMTAQLRVEQNEYDIEKNTVPAPVPAQVVQRAPVSAAPIQQVQQVRQVPVQQVQQMPVQQVQPVQQVPMQAVQQMQPVQQVPVQQMPAQPQAPVYTPVSQPQYQAQQQVQPQVQTVFVPRPTPVEEASSESVQPDLLNQ